MAEKKEYFGRINFEAYNKSVGGVTYDGKPIPKWEDLSHVVRTAWCAGASGVITDYELQVSGETERPVVRILPDDAQCLQKITATKVCHLPLGHQGAHDEDP